MDFEKYTDKSKQIIQAAQELALRSGHQRFRRSMCSQPSWTTANACPRS